MLVSKEVLESVGKDLSFYNLDELIEISDIDHIQKKLVSKMANNCLYWVDLDEIQFNFLQSPRGIILISRKLFEKIEITGIFNSRVIVSDDPSLLFFSIAEFLCNGEIVPRIHSSATVHPGAVLGNNIYIGPGAVIDLCEIGDNCIIQSNCSIGNGVKIGNNSVIHSGAKIGFNVFSFKQNPSGDWMKYQQIAGVSIGKNVTIGSNTCINNGFVTDTIIRDNSFIDSLCQIQGSVVIGEKTIIASCSFIATNVIIGNNCWISPNVSFKESIIIADDVFVGIGSVVLRSIKKSCRVFGIPAKELPTI